MVIQLHDKHFELYIKSEEIKERVQNLALQISSEYQGKEVHLICVLKGAFMFFSDLVKNINGNVQVHFLRVKSYEGTSSNGNVKIYYFEQLEIPENAHILLVEDIVDTGSTLVKLYADFAFFNPASLKIASLLFKKEAYKSNLPVNFFAFEIPNKFVVGYGLDYDELGRNLPELYKLK